MSTMIGSNVEELRALASEFESRAATLSGLETELTGRIHSAPWHGADVGQFQQDWSTAHRTTLIASASAMAEAAQTLRVNADQQEHASAASNGGERLSPWDRIKGLWDRWTKYQEEQKQHHRLLASQLESMKSASAEDVQKWWNSLSEADRTYLLQGKDPETGLPLANTLLAIQDKLPPGVVEEARKARFELEKSEIPVYDVKTALGVDGRVAWVHGGAHLTSQLKMHADGSVDLKLSGDLGGGANVPGGAAGATLTGEISRTYHFDSLADAMAAQDQMLRDIPPDEVGELRDLADDPGDYVSDKLDAAAAAHGSTGHEDKWKGTFSIEGEYKAADKGQISGKLEGSYEQNVTDGSSTASIAVSGKAKLDLGDGAGFSGWGEAKLKLDMDPSHNIEKVTIEVQGTLMGIDKLKFGGGADSGAVAAVDASRTPLTGSFSAEAGVHGSVKIQVVNTPENAALIKDYISHAAAGNQDAAAQDLARLYHAGQAVIQFDAATKTEANVVDVDNPAFKLKAGMQTETITNVATIYKAPNDMSYQYYAPNVARLAASRG